MPAYLAPLRRTLVAMSVAVGASISLLSFLIQPAYTDDPDVYVAALAASPTAEIAFQCFTLAQIFWAIGLVGVAHVASRRAPVLALIGGVLAGLGAFGHSFHGGTALTQLALARTDADAAVAAMTAIQSTAFLPYMAMGLLGTAVGTIVLGVAVMRSRTAPLWVSIGLIAWTVIEFVLPSFVDWSTYVSMVVGVIVFAGLAIAVWRSDLATWRTQAEASVALTTPADPIALA